MGYIHTGFAKLSVRVIYAGEIHNYREYISTKSFARLHTANLSWAGMDTWAREGYALFVWFYE